MDYNVGAKLYTGSYGVKDRAGDLIVTQISCLGPAVKKDKHLIFLIDVSGSMSGTEVTIKVSLLTLRDILGSHFGDDVKITIITYSSSAKQIWTQIPTVSATGGNTNGGYGYEDLKETLDTHIKMEGGTNFYAALTSAFEKIDAVGKPI